MTLIAFFFPISEASVVKNWSIWKRTFCKIQKAVFMESQSARWDTTFPNFITPENIILFKSGSVFFTITFNTRWTTKNKSHFFRSIDLFTYKTLAFSRVCKWIKLLILYKHFNVSDWKVVINNIHNNVSQKKKCIGKQHFN